jgi:hypothetical protein
MIFRNLTLGQDASATHHGSTPQSVLTSLELSNKVKFLPSREIIRFMPADEQYEELQRRVAALTERVYKLEQVAGMRPGLAPRSEAARRQVEENTGIRGARKELNWNPKLADIG